MTTSGLDPRHTFETFVVGSANRLASAAARRVAESPGSTYNPLFIYSASGLGKTHLAMAIGHHTRHLFPSAQVLYDTLEHFMEEVMQAIEAGERESFRLRLGELQLLLLDDVQFLAGRHRSQEELLRVWDIITSQGGQVVLMSDRPPQEIDGLDDRLLSRFSGGLIVDIGAPDYETRVAITRLKAEHSGQTLAAGVAETLSRIAFSNVRELQGALNRLLAVQELEGRAIAAEEVSGLLGRMASPAQIDEFGSFLAEVTDTLEAVVEPERSPLEARLATQIQRWQGEGYGTRRLEAALADLGAESGHHAESGIADEAVVETLIEEYEGMVARLREITAEIGALEPGAPELERHELLRDPDRLREAEALLGTVQARCRPLPVPPAESTFDQVAIPAELLAVRAALALAEGRGERYSPLYIHGPEGSGKSTLLGAIGNRHLELEPAAEVAFVTGEGFAAELIEALEHNQVESWRARYRRARLLLLDDLEALSGTERAQDELFHLFDALQRAGAQLAFTATCPPDELSGIEERLRTRLGAGLVVESSYAEPGRKEKVDAWFLDREKVVWSWPYIEEFLHEEWK